MYILTFDVGTTSVKVCIFNRELKIVSQSSEEYSLLTDSNNIVEVNPKTYLDAIKNGFKKIVSNPKYMEIAAICIATQGETLIPVDCRGNALRNAIVWLDGRADEEASYISSLSIAQDFYKKTGVLSIDSSVPISKLLWIKRHEPEVYEKTHKFLLLEDYIVLNLTGEFVTDRGIMCTTGYYDIRKDDLYHEMLDTLEIDTNKIPKINPSGEFIGNITKQISVDFGISPNAVVVSGTMDQIASAVGAGNITEGIITESTGTCMAISGTVDEHIFEKTNNIQVYTHVMPDKYLALCLCKTAGIVLKWFKDEFCESEIIEAKRTGKDVYDILGKIADEVTLGSNGLILVPYFNGVLHPENMPSVRGVFFGVSLDTKKPQFIRAIFEGICFMLRENLALFQNIGIEVRKITSLGGGAKSQIWQQIKSDITNSHIDTLEESECTSLGVAILAACALKWYSTIEEACAKNAIKHTAEPNAGIYEVYNRQYQKYLKIYSCTREMF